MKSRCPRSMHRVHAVAALLGAALTSSTARAQFVPIRDLDPQRLTQGVAPSRVLGGVACGWVADPATSWQLPASMGATGVELLDLLPGHIQGFAADLNRDGTIVGSGYLPGAFLPTPHVWSGGTVTDANVLVTGGADYEIRWCRAIDDDGRIAGVGTDRSNGVMHAVLLDAGLLQDLGALVSASNGSESFAMNDRGTVVGSSDVPNGYHACMFRGGQVIDLHDPSLMPGDSSIALDVDRFDRVVGLYGYLAGPALIQHGFFFDGNVTIDLGFNTQANGINDFGVIVGHAASAGGYVAMQWIGGSMTDLNTLIDPALGWELQSAVDVDNEGRIVGIGLLSGVPTGFILEPVCAGGFTVYGTGCPGMGGRTPQLLGTGCPSPDRDFALLARSGVPHGVGFRLVGGGTGSARVKPGCDVQVLPLVAPILPFVLDSFGEQWTSARIPPGTAPVDLYLQDLFFDAGAPFGISSSRPLQISLR